MLFQGFISGMGMRQMARIYHTSRDVVADKLERLSKRCRQFHDSYAREIAAIRRIGFDELETFELCRVTMPVTMGTVIDMDSMFIVEQGNAAIKARSKLTKRSEELIAKQAIRYGPRPHNSYDCVRRLFERTRDRLLPNSRIDLISDLKTTYGPLARKIFGLQLGEHYQFSSKMVRNANSPMHRINLTNAMWRDNLGRLRRRSWLASKCRHWLDKHAWLFVVYRNYIRPRFNGEELTPAQRVGVMARKLDFDDILQWQ